MDSSGNISNEIDLAIFDEQYIPYIFGFENIKFIPIEAVAVVIECKSTNLDQDTLEKWSKSIDILGTSLNSIVRMQARVVITDSNSLSQTSKSTQTSTRPIKILCHIAQKENSSIQELFDLVLQGEKDKINLHISDNKRLSKWYKELNHHKSEGNIENYIMEYNDKNLQSGEKAKNQPDPYLNEFIIMEKGEKENTILSLIFVLNQLLMLINNPIFFPHRSYVKLFNDIGGEVI